MYVTGKNTQYIWEYQVPPGDSTGIDDNEPNGLGVPKVASLGQNYPNPFNPSTTIVFNVPGESGKKELVKLSIYDTRGRYVKTLIDSELESGAHKIVWDGKNEEGKSVSSGIYLYTLSTKNEMFTKKMTVLK
jgi:flagellar hook assembly protein FlgD